MVMKILLLLITVWAVPSAQQLLAPCIPGAIPTANGDCVCAPGLEGHPDLCCVPPNRQSCYVSGDPVLKAYSGNKVGLDFPCGTMVSSSQEALGKPVVNVFVASKESETGSIFTSMVVVQIRASRFATFTFNFDLQPMAVECVMDDGTTELFYMEDQRGPRMFPDFSRSLAVNIALVYNGALRLYQLIVGNTHVYIRPRNVYGSQSYTPGMCVSQPQGGVLPNPGSSYSCSLNKDITQTTVREYLDFAIQPMKNYMFNTGILKQTTSLQYYSMCGRFQDIMSGNCQAADRYDAMKKCAFILFQPIVRRCFHEASNGDARAMKAFNFCLETYCKGTTVLCQKMKNDIRFKFCAPNLLDCHKWNPYRRVNSFIAGEGGNQNFGQETQNTQAATTPFSFLGSGGILGEGQGQDQSNNNAGGVNNFNPNDFGLKK